jgi:hypothetical protein
MNVNIFLIISIALIFTTLACDGRESDKSKDPNSWDDAFNSDNGDWMPISFEGSPNGSYKIDGGILSIDAAGEGFYGVYHTQPVRGHFYVTADYTVDDNVALVLLNNKNGQPDLYNYTLIRVETENGVVRVAVNDRQTGIDNVLDMTNSTIPENEGHPRDGYEHILDNTKISLPYTQTDKRIKIFRHNGSNYFQFYYGVRGTFHGSEGADWMELRPSPNWQTDGSYFVGLISTGGRAEFTHVSVTSLPITDRDDTGTGFALTERDYNWSGYTGPAFVVTFGDECAYRKNNLKFVFWSEFSWVPHWYLTDQLAYTYEFVETWTGPEANWAETGCYEPMSDRLRVHSDVKVIEDNPVRKILKWGYRLLNPKYEIPYNLGAQMPMAQETFTLSADGTGVRHVRFYPKLDINEIDWNEVSEPMLISGNNSNSRDFADDPPMTLYDLDGNKQELFRENRFGYGSEVDDYQQVIAQAHFKDQYNVPDIIEVFSMDPAYPGTFSALPLRFEHTWQSPNGLLTHWPVNKRPYHAMAYSGGRSVDPHVEVSHASLVSVGFRELDVYPAKSHYEKYGQIDPANGRKYVEWSFLIGPVTRRDFTEAENKTKSWLIRNDEISMINSNSKFVGVSESERALVFDNTTHRTNCEFTIDHSIVINPVIRIKNWKGSTSISVSINDNTIPDKQYRSYVKNNGDLLVFINQTISGSAKLTIGP